MYLIGRVNGYGFELLDKTLELGSITMPQDHSAVYFQLSGSRIHVLQFTIYSTKLLLYSQSHDLFPPLPPKNPNLIMNSLPIRTHRRLLKRLRQRRMRMTRPPHILTTSSILQRQHPLRNHLPRIRPHNMDPQNAIRFRIRHKLHHPFRFQIRFRPTIRAKRERARFIFDSLFF